MLINLRNALMTGKRLPYDAEVEYLESTGTQYIDTGVLIDTSTDTVEITFMPHAETSGYQAYYGIDETGNGQFSLRKNTNGNNIQVLKGTGVSAGITADEKWHTVKVTPNKAIVDGIDIALTQADAQYTKSLMLFARITTVDTITAYAKCRIASFKIYRNSTLVRDYIPVRKGTVGYLYDRVSGKLFGNAGTGDFVVGQDVVPVEYIESHGTEWIDTDIVAADDVGYELRLVDWQSLWPSTANFMFAGVFGSSNRYGLGCTGRPNAPQSNAFMWWNSAFANLGTIGAISNGYLRFNFLNSRSYDFNGVISGSLSGSYNASNTTIRLLNAKRMDTGENAFPNSVPAKISAFKISKDNAPVRKFRPVRVGTEGAMMDVLTRRIYRNAGTGAFTYGNDLKYPIPAE